MGLLAVGFSNGIFELLQLPDLTTVHTLSIGRWAAQAGLVEAGCHALLVAAGGQCFKHGHAALRLQQAAAAHDCTVQLTHCCCPHSCNREKLSSMVFNATGDWIAVGSAKLGQLLVWEWRR